MCAGLKAAAGRSRQPVLITVIGIAIWLAGWEVAGRSGLLGSSWPPLSEVIQYASEQPTRQILLTGAQATATEAVQGYLLASILACCLAAAGLLVPGLGRGLSNAVVLLNTIPIIVLGPLFLATLSAARAPLAMAAFMVLLTMYLAASSGLHSASPTHRAVFLALGSSRWRRLVSLDVPSAVPAVLDGLKVCAPLAFLGAIIGEWFGSDKGIGLLLVSAMQNFQAELLWAAALMTVLLSSVVFLLLSGLQRAVAWRFQ
jgi:NitT/TauT family transport system permease protein